MKRLETKRTTLREWKLSDAVDVYEYAKLPNVGPMAGWQPHKDIGESKEIVTKFIETDETWAIVYNGKVIGSVGLHKDRKLCGDYHVRQIGYVMAPQYWGQGLMTEIVKEVMRFAFCEYNVDMITIGHYEFNDRSRRVIEKCGFKYEGSLRNAYKKDGILYSVSNYSLTKEEYFEQHKG